MKQFSFKRFWQLLSSYMADNKKRLMIFCGGLFAATIVLFSLGMLMGATANIGKDAHLDIDMKVMQMITAIGHVNNLVGIASMVIFSRVFVNMEQRSGEIQFLMLPATAMEKWLSRVAYVVLAGWVMPTLVTYAGILTWTGVASLLGYENGATLLHIMFDTTYALYLMHISYPASLVFLTYSFACFEVAYFIYGGTVFRHNAWLKSMAIFFGIIMVIAFSFGIYMGYNIVSRVSTESTQINSTQDVMDIISLTHYSAVFLWGAIVSLVLTPLMLRLSYRSFKKRQLETRKYNIIIMNK